MDQVTNCTKSLDSTSLAERSRSTRIKDLEIQLQEAEQRVDHANKARTKELDALKSKLKDAESAISSLQTQLDEGLKETAEQSEKVRDLTDKLNDCIGKPSEVQQKKQTQGRDVSLLDDSMTESQSPMSAVSEAAYYDDSSDYYMGFQPPEIRSFNLYSSRKRT